jgi:hypothetical protein
LLKSPAFVVGHLSWSINKSRAFGMGERLSATAEETGFSRKNQVSKRAEQHK